MEKPEEMDDAMRVAMSAVKQFLSLIGITYGKGEDGGGHVYFHRAPFMIIDADLKRTALRDKI